MILLICLLLLTILGFYLCFSENTEGTIFGVLGALIVVVFGLAFLSYAIGIPLSSYNYQKAESVRKSIQTSIDLARENKNQFEVASITRDVIEFNKFLEWEQMQNSYFLLDPLIDDRIMNLKTIQ